MHVCGHAVLSLYVTNHITSLSLLPSSTSLILSSFFTFTSVHSTLPSWWLLQYNTQRVFMSSIPRWEPTSIPSRSPFSGSCEENCCLQCWWKDLSIYSYSSSTNSLFRCLILILLSYRFLILLFHSHLRMESPSSFYRLNTDIQRILQHSPSFYLFKTLF